MNNILFNCGLWNSVNDIINQVLGVILFNLNLILHINFKIWIYKILTLLKQFPQISLSSSIDQFLFPYVDLGVYILTLFNFYLSITIIFIFLFKESFFYFINFIQKINIFFYIVIKIMIKRKWKSFFLIEKMESWIIGIHKITLRILIIIKLICLRAICRYYCIAKIFHWKCSS